MVARTISNGGSRKPQEEISIGVIENSYKSDTKASLSSAGYCSWARVPRIKIDRSRIILPSNFTVAVARSNLHGVVRRLAFPAIRFFHSMNRVINEGKRYLFAGKLEILNDVIIIFEIQLKRSFFFFFLNTIVQDDSK